jgi:hypothetical protein
MMKKNERNPAKCREEQRPELWKDLLRYGEILKAWDLNTANGYYSIRVISYEGGIYFHKMIDGEPVTVRLLTGKNEK